MPQLISQRHLFIAQPPLYRIRGGGEQTWLYSEAAKEEKIRSLSGKRISVQRYKGLGEMTPEQLWETTMNPVTRTLLEVEVDDAARADEVFHMLMGGEIPPRKAFIQAHATSVKNLDI
jgi:DNA gyrase subunit B